MKRPSTSAPQLAYLALLLFNNVELARPASTFVRMQLATKVCVA